MARPFSAVLAVLALAALPLPAAALGIGPSVQLYIDGNLEVDLTCADDAALTELTCDGKETFELDMLTVDVAAAKVTFSLFMDPDPQIIYTANVEDLGAASTFQFIFSQGIAATGTPGLAHHDVSAGTSDVDGGGVAVTALAPPAGIPADSDATPEIFVFTLDTDGGASFASAELDFAGDFAGDADTSDTQGPFDDDLPGPAGSGLYDAMRIDINFGLPGGGDIYTFTGTASIVPEPGSFGLLALGLAALAARRRRG